MHDIYELAATALCQFYNQQGGLRTICYRLQQDQGRVYRLASCVALNAETLVVALQDADLRQRFDGVQLTTDDFVLLALVTDERLTGTRVSKKLRLSATTRAAIKRLPQKAVGIELKALEAQPTWLRVPKGLHAPSATQQHNLLSNFVKLPPDAQISTEERDICVAQSLSSGLPVHALTSCLRDAGSMTLLDACAAPGSKTLQASEVFKRVIACEKDRQRAEILRKRCQTAKNVSVIAGDAFDAFQQQKFDCILLDPTCSGSGTVSADQKMAECLKCAKERAEVSQLAAFQLRILKAALDTGCRAVSYSTCSIYHEENEQVVEAALQDYGSQYKLANALPQWPMRGTKYPECLRSGEQMQSEGFFVAVFIRK